MSGAHVWSSYTTSQDDRDHFYNCNIIKNVVSYFPDNKKERHTGCVGEGMEIR